MGPTGRGTGSRGPVLVREEQQEHSINRTIS